MTQLAGRRESRRSMRRIRRAAVVLLVARIAQRTVERIVVSDVAIRALARRHGVRSRQLESRRRVIERAIGPEHSVVARFASCREAGSNVVHRRECIGVVALVARYAGGARQVVVVVHVAIGTLPRRNGVRPGQRESRAVVVEGRIQPGTCVVTLLAGLRKIRRHVIRIGRALEILQVAGHARRTAQRVVVVDMAIYALARRNSVHSRKGEAGRGMIELAVRPQHRVVALLASGGESGMRHGRGGVVVVVLMAAHASRAGDVVVVVDVAIRALARWDRMGPGQRESGLRVIKSRRLPRARVVTHLAGLREPSGHVIWIIRPLKIFQVT